MIQTHLLLVVFRMCFLICFVVFVFLVLTRASDLSVDMFLGSTNLMDGMEDLPPGIGQYDDFHTIDWLRDISRDRMRHRHIVKRRQEGCFEKLKAAHDAWSGWVCVLLVGCAAGLFCIHTHSGISWTICNSAPGSRQITTPTRHRSDFYRPDALPATQPTVSKH